jgi:hypothetical protein
VLRRVGSVIICGGQALDGYERVPGRVQHQDHHDERHQGLQLYPALPAHAQDPQHSHQVSFYYYPNVINMVRSFVIVISYSPFKETVAPDFLPPEFSLIEPIHTPLHYAAESLKKL